MRCLAKEVREGLLALRARQFRDQIVDLRVGTQGNIERDLSIASDRLAQLGRQRIDRAALDTGSGHDRFAPDGVCTECQRHTLERLPLETVAKDIRPDNGETGIGRAQRRYFYAFG